MDTHRAPAAAQDKSSDRLVEITVDRVVKQIEKGPYELADFKRLVGINPTYDVDELIDGQFVPLDPSNKVHVKGGEVFVSHVPQGGSS